MTTAPSRAQVDAASTTVSATGQATILALIRQSNRYRNASLGYPDLEGMIATVAGEAGLKARQLNAALELLEAVGTGEMEVNEDGAKISLPDDRAALVEYMIAVLYSEPVGPFLSGRRVTSTTYKSPGGW